MPIPPRAVQTNAGNFVYVSTISSPKIHQHCNGSETVVIKRATAEEVNPLRRAGKNHPNIIRYVDSLGEEIIVVYQTPRSFLLVMERADLGTTEDLITHIRSLSTYRRPRLVLPLELLYHILANIIEAVLYLETSLPLPIQHIDCHIGNVAFLRSPSSWPSVKIMDFHRIQPGDEGCPPPAIGVFARSLLQNRSVLPLEFVGVLKQLSAPLMSLTILRTARADALCKASKCDTARLPPWLINYF